MKQYINHALVNTHIIWAHVGEIYVELCVLYSFFPTAIACGLKICEILLIYPHGQNQHKYPFSFGTMMPCRSPRLHLRIENIHLLLITRSWFGYFPAKTCILFEL